MREVGSRNGFNQCYAIHNFIYVMFFLSLASLSLLRLRRKRQNNFVEFMSTSLRPNGTDLKFDTPIIGISEIDFFYLHFFNRII